MYDYCQRKLLVKFKYKLNLFWMLAHMSASEQEKWWNNEQRAYSLSIEMLDDK